MQLLQEFARQNPRWCLEELVELANQLLPQFLPDQEVDSRLQDTVNARLVRYYTTQGLLDKPQKQGREARYIYRHLLQLLLLRRLLAEGYSSGSLSQLVLHRSNAELEDLLQGGAQLTVAAANPALGFLAQVRERAAPAPPSISCDSPSTSSPTPTAEAKASPLSAAGLPPSGVSPPGVLDSRWTRHALLAGLELHIREDFVYPSNPRDREALLQLIATYLIPPHPTRRKPP